MKFLEGPKASCEGCTRQNGTASLKKCRECVRWLCQTCFGSEFGWNCEKCESAEPEPVIRLGGNVEDKRTELFMDDHDGGGWDY